MVWTVILRVERPWAKKNETKQENMGFGRGGGKEGAVEGCVLKFRAARIFFASRARMPLSEFPGLAATVRSLAVFQGSNSRRRPVCAGKGRCCSDVHCWCDVFSGHKPCLDFVGRSARNWVPNAQAEQIAPLLELWYLAHAAWLQLCQSVVKGLGAQPAKPIPFLPHGS